MKKQAKGPKFRVGQVVAVRDYRWQQWEYRILVPADEGVKIKHVRPLTVREAGPARGRKARKLQGK